MTKETMFDVKISASDLARLSPEQPIVTPAGQQTVLRYVTTGHPFQGRGLWVLEPVPAEAAIAIACKGSYALGTACGKCARCAKERASVGDGSLSHENVVKFFTETWHRCAPKPLPQTYALTVSLPSGAVRCTSGIVNHGAVSSDGTVTFAAANGGRHVYLLNSITGWSLEPEKEEVKK